MNYVFTPYKESNNVINKRKQQDTATAAYQNYYNNPYVTGQGGLGTQLSSAQSKLDNLYNNNNLSQQFKYDPKKQKLYDKAYSNLVNRKPFEYDLANDQLFQQYKDNYQAMGKAAMADTMGQAASMTGGYGNSYATAAANQTYNNYLQQINNSIGDFYNMALSGYQTESDRLNNVFNAASTDRTAAQNEWKGNWDVYNNLYKMYSDNYNNLLNQDINLYGQRGSALGNIADLYTKQYGTESANDINLWDSGNKWRAEQSSQDENRKHNRNTEKLSRDQLNETIRSNQADEQYKTNALNETIRSNKANEGINSLKALYGNSGGSIKSPTDLKNIIPRETDNTKKVLGSALRTADVNRTGAAATLTEQQNALISMLNNADSKGRITLNDGKKVSLGADELAYVYDYLQISSLDNSKNSKKKGK